MFNLSECHSLVLFSHYRANDARARAQSTNILIYILVYAFSGGGVSFVLVLVLVLHNIFGFIYLICFRSLPQPIENGAINRVALDSIV